MRHHAITGRSDDHRSEGLAVDLARLIASAGAPAVIGRRRALRAIGGFGLLTVLAACGSGSGSATPTTGVGTGSAADDGGAVGPSAGSEIPDETAGPYPGDGSNGPNVLTESGVVRSDIRSSFGSSTTTVDGVPLTVTLTVVDATSGDPVPGAAVYLWHCDALGRYSLYSSGVEGENFLRGVQVADDDGALTFTTIVPGCYSGRWPHAHFEVYDSLDVASSGPAARKTSQLALPEDVCGAVYALDAYQGSTANLSRLSLDSDNIFSDGWDDQLVTVSGSLDEGYASSLLVRI